MRVGKRRASVWALGPIACVYCQSARSNYHQLRFSAQCARACLSVMPVVFAARVLEPIAGNGGTGLVEVGAARAGAGVGWRNIGRRDTTVSYRRTPQHEQSQADEQTAHQGGRDQQHATGSPRGRKELWLSLPSTEAASCSTTGLVRALLSLCCARFRSAVCRSNQCRLVVVVRLNGGELSARALGRLRISWRARRLAHRTVFVRPASRESPRSSSLRSRPRIFFFLDPARLHARVIRQQGD